MTHDLARLQRLLGGAGLAGLRQRLRARFGRAAPAEAFTLTGLTPTERRALEGLLGRASTQAASLRLSHAELDMALARAGLAADLHAALVALDGPIHTHADRQRRTQAWQDVFASVTDARLQSVLDTAAGQGLVKRLAGTPEAAGDLLASAAQVLTRLPAHGIPLAELAAASVGDAHALDPGGRLAALVLRAAEASGHDGDKSPSGDEKDERLRSRWARQGVAVNELAAPVLCLNLDAAPDTVCGQWLTAARQAGEPLHLSLRSLLRAPPQWRVKGQPVFVCENPAVVAIAAQRLGAVSAPLVCTDGMPAAAQRTLLAQLAASGAQLRYHGDFDWPGLRIGNFVMRSFGAEPWRFAAQDYAATSGRALDDRVAAASWDAHLAPKMQAVGYALDEEAVVEVLMADLATERLL